MCSDTELCKPHSILVLVCIAECRVHSEAADKAHGGNRQVDRVLGYILNWFNSTVTYNLLHRCCVILNKTKRERQSGIS